MGTTTTVGSAPLLPAHDQAAVGSLAAVDQAVVEPLRILRIGGHQLVLPAVGHHAVKQAAHLLLAVRAFLAWSISGPLKFPKIPMTIPL